MELSLAVVGVLGATAGVIRASSCKRVGVCWGLLACEKETLEVPPSLENDIELSDIRAPPLLPSGETS